VVVDTVVVPTIDDALVSFNSVIISPTQCYMSSVELCRAAVMQRVMSNGKHVMQKPDKRFAAVTYYCVSKQACIPRSRTWSTVALAMPVALCLYVPMCQQHEGGRTHDMPAA
jgi:hypothetical protein